MNGDHDGVTMAGQGFIDGIVEHLEYHVMQAAAILGVANVHAWAFAYRIQTF